jgi:hypothetical protein
MVTDNILEFQNNGHRSTSSAIAEIIDNSIQADSKNIDIVIIRNTKRTENEIEEILIIDDGFGMNEDTFNNVLQIGTSRGRANSGSGRYGVGLPWASISQTKRVEVYTIQKNKKLFNYIDLEEINENRKDFLPEIEHLDIIKIPIFEDGKISISQNGTIVRWVKPNRLVPKTAKTLADHIEKVCGKIYRNLINGYTGRDKKEYKVHINVMVYDYDNESFEINDALTKRSIKAFDPMFLMQNTQMNELFPLSIHPTSQIYPYECKRTFTIEGYNEKIETTVEIKFSYCKKEERNRYGSNASATRFRNMYYKRNMLGGSRFGYQNISVIRAGIEIDSGDFGFLNSLEETDRWWSAEILVNPEIDSIIGVTNNKRYALNIKYIDKSWGADANTHEILRWISTYLEQNIKTVRKLINIE